jgi:hypothetical protein
LEHRPYPLANIPIKVRRIIAREVEERSIECKCRYTKARAIYQIILEWEEMQENIRAKRVEETD